MNQLGDVADNLRTGATSTIQWHEVDAALDAGATLVDVRDADEHTADAVPGAVSISVDELRDRLHELPDGPLTVHCQLGQRGHTAARILTQHGREVRNLDGGYRTWVAGTTHTAGRGAHALRPAAR